MVLEISVIAAPCAFTGSTGTSNLGEHPCTFWLLFDQAIDSNRLLADDAGIGASQ